MIKYIPTNDLKVVFKTKELVQSAKIELPRGKTVTHINIVQCETSGRLGLTVVKLRIFYSDGEIIDGWTGQMDHNCPIKIYDPRNELLDGRFNV